MQYGRKVAGAIKSIVNTKGLNIKLNALESCMRVRCMVLKYGRCVG